MKFLHNRFDHSKNFLNALRPSGTSSTPERLQAKFQLILSAKLGPVVLTGGSAKKKPSIIRIFFGDIYWCQIFTQSEIIRPSVDHWFQRIGLSIPGAIMAISTFKIDRLGRGTGWSKRVLLLSFFINGYNKFFLRI